MNPTQEFLAALPWDLSLSVLGGVGLIRGGIQCPDRVAKIVLGSNGIEVITTSTAGVIDHHTFEYRHHLTKFEPEGYATDLEGPLMVVGSPAIREVGGVVQWVVESAGGYRSDVKPLEDEVKALCHEIGQYARVWLGLNG